MKPFLLISIALAAPGLLGSDDIFKPFADVEKGFDSDFGSDFGGMFGGMPGGLLDRGDVRAPSQKDDASQAGWNFDPVTGKPLHKKSAAKTGSNRGGSPFRGLGGFGGFGGFDFPKMDMGGMGDFPSMGGMDMPGPGDSSSQHHESKRVQRDDNGNVMQSFSSSSSFSSSNFGDEDSHQTEKKIHVKMPAGMQPCTKAVVYVMKRHHEDDREIAANKECFQAIVDEDKKRVVVREYGAKFDGIKKQTGASDMAQRKDSNEHSFNLPFAVDKTSVKDFHYSPKSGDLVLNLKAKAASPAPEESAQDFFSGAGDADDEA